MNRPLFSIIIPAYNVETKIKKCVDSVASQAEGNTQIIIVDDGSTDHTLQVCQMLANQYPMVSVIHQKNSGVSSARNIGLQEALGEWIIFIDSDDCVERNYLEDIYCEIQNNDSDLIIYGYKKVYRSNQVCEVQYSELNTGLYTKDAVLQKIYNEKCYKGFLWNKIFRNSIINKYGIKFDASIKLGEDLLFCVQYLYRTERPIKLLNKSYYLYNISTDNTSNSLKRETLYSREICFDKILEIDPLLTDKIFFQNTICEYTKILILNVFQADYLNRIYDNEHRAATISKIKKLNAINRVSIKYRVLYILLHLRKFGYYIYRRYHRIR